MSDLFCPATLILARHGAAEYELGVQYQAKHKRWLRQGGSLTHEGRRQTVDLAERLADRKVAQIYTSTMARAVQTGEIVAADLDLDVTTRVGLEEVGLDESLDHVAHRLLSVIEEISDLFRGQTVLVVTHRQLIEQALPLITRGSGRVPCRWTGAYCSTLEILVDADGIVCTAESVSD